MKQILLSLVVLGIVAGVLYRYRHRNTSPTFASHETVAAPAAAKFICDGRVYCSQMHSCEEATFFLQNCPGTKMDGDNDGVPCEKQWC